MFLTINLRAIGINLRGIMGKRGIEPKDIQKYLNLASEEKESRQNRKKCG